MDIRTNFPDNFLVTGGWLTVVAFDKTTNTACANAMLKTPYDFSLMESLSSLEIYRDILPASHKTMLELPYCIWSVDKKGQCQEDIFITTGLEAPHNLNLNERCQFTGCLKNKWALCIFFLYGLKLSPCSLGPF